MLIEFENESQKRIGGEWSPAGAERTWHGFGGESFDLYGGSYELTSVSRGYQQVTQSVEIPDTDTHIVRVSLVALPGNLTVQVQDVHGETIEGAVWRSPQNDYTEVAAGAATELAPGTIELVVTAPGYEAKQTRTKIGAGAEETVVVTLKK